MPPFRSFKSRRIYLHHQRLQGAQQCLALEENLRELLGRFLRFCLTSRADKFTRSGNSLSRATAYSLPVIFRIRKTFNVNPTTMVMANTIHINMILRFNLAAASRMAGLR